MAQTWLARYRLYRALPAPCGSTHRLNIFLNPELCFAVLISLQHNVPLSPLLSSCSLITRSPLPTLCYPLFSFEAEKRKLQKKQNKKNHKKNKHKKKQLWGNICHLWQRNRGLFWVFFFIIILFQCDMLFHHEILQSCYRREQSEKRRASWVFVWKTIFNKGRTNSTKSVF